MKYLRPLALSVLSLGAVGLAAFRWNYRMPLRDYTRHALYMAALDDEIARTELSGTLVNGRPVVFPERSRSLQYRYHLFLQRNRHASQRQLQTRSRNLEQRLDAARAEHGRS